MKPLETKERYLKEVEEISNRELLILNKHLLRSFQRFAQKIFQLNKRTFKMEFKE